MDCLEHPIGIAIFKDVLYCAESKKDTKDAVAFKDLTSEIIVDVTKLTVEKPKEKLKFVEKWNHSCPPLLTMMEWRLEEETKEVPARKTQRSFKKHWNLWAKRIAT